MTRSRREFLQLSALSLGALGVRARAASASEGVSIILDPRDSIASSAPCRWAVDELRHALQQRGITVRNSADLEHAPARDFCILASGPRQGPANAFLQQANVALPVEPESLALVPFSNGGHGGTVACGHDSRGLMYALLELADRIHYAENPLAALAQRAALIEKPFNEIRSLGRLFTSDIEDKPWFYDREMWPAYFSMLAAQRYNRFSLNLGLGYDFLNDVRDAYFLFAYPFLLSVPGYNVRAVNLPDAERDRNLDMLQFISSQAVAHGLDFQLGLWTHGYTWGPASQPNYTIEGLTPDNHAAYSRDALTALLKACPDISGVSLRTHGESGVREGSYGFWQTVFSGAAQCGRKVNLDLHTKGLDQKLIDAALATQLPVILAPKYWAEHMGMSYQQASIRELEMPHEDEHASGFFSLSSGSRSFTRYGYADFLREDRRYRVMFRIWPGTHRFLLWGDPESSAANARAFQFAGCNGVELFEPLSFKGREGSGIAGSRCGYADHTLDLRWDWEKYAYTHRVWARLLYNPQTSPHIWERYLRKEFLDAASSVETALASATSILPIVTTAHLPSAANAVFNPELYTNQSMLDPSPHPYNDTPAPKVFGNVSALDPQLFSSVNEFAAELLNGERTGKYSPLEVAQWLQDASDSADRHLNDAEARVGKRQSAEFRRLVVDIRLQIGLGRFFAAELRTGTLFSIYEQSRDSAALNEALQEYRRAQEVWSHFAQAAKEPYVSDITFGPMPYQRGHWLDRLAAIDADIEEMEKRLQSAAPTSESPEAVQVAIKQALARPTRDSVDVRHEAPAGFNPGEPLPISLAVPQSAGSLQVRLYYRHVNQAERYANTEMLVNRNQFSATVPGEYTNSKFPIEYYFELRRGPASAWLYPGLGPRLLGQPYFVVRQS